MALTMPLKPVEFRDHSVAAETTIPSNKGMVPLYRPWFVRMGECQAEPCSVSSQSCLMHFNPSVYFSLTWCLERKMPVGKKPVSLSSPAMAGEVWRSSGHDELVPPAAQTAPEAFQPPRNSQELSPSLQTGNCSQQCGTAQWSYAPGCHLLTHPIFFFSFWFLVGSIFFLLESFSFSLMHHVTELMLAEDCSWFRASEQQGCGVGYWESQRGSAEC